MEKRITAETIFQPSHICSSNSCDPPIPPFRSDLADTVISPIGHIQCPAIQGNAANLVKARICPEPIRKPPSPIPSDGANRAVWRDLAHGMIEEFRDEDVAIDVLRQIVGEGELGAGGWSVYISSFTCSS